MLSDYDGMPVEKAVAKLKAKPSHDAQDIEFARARQSYFSDAEFAAITGGQKAQGEADEAPADAPVAPAPEDAPAAPQDAEAGSVNPDSHTKDELQAMAAELNLDTSGTKAELAARISEARKAA